MSDDKAATRRKILLYCGALVGLLGFATPAGGLIGLPLIFFLKNKLHLQAHELAQFLVWASAPVYGAIGLGYLRDRWSPFGRGDRGYLMLFGALTAGLYTTLAFAQPTYWTLLVGLLAIATSILIVYSATNGLTAVLAREHLISGQVSAVWSFVNTLPTIAGLLLGGALSEELEAHSAPVAARVFLLVGGALMAAMALFGVLKPRSIFAGLAAAAPGAGKSGSPLIDLARLAAHRPVYPAMIIWAFWSFSPGSQTPLQYHLANTLHASDSQFGLYSAIYQLCLIPTYVLFGVLAPKVSLRALLWWGAAVGAPGMIPLLFIHSAAGALLVAVPMGLLAGMANAAFLGLLIRSCPKGLEGTVMMLALSLMSLFSNLGDLVGATLYDRSGDFLICVAASTASNLAILLVLPFIPAALVAVPDGRAAGAGA